MSAVDEIAEACRRVQDTISLSDLAARAGVHLTRRGGEWAGCCPFHPDRSPSFTIYASDRRFMCFGCEKEGDAIDFVRLTYGVRIVDALQLIDSGALPTIKREPVEHDAPVDRTPEAATIWRNAVAAENTPAEAYLRRRGIDIALPRSIRFARLPWGRRSWLPAMVALIVNSDGQPCGIQRTFLTEDGGKADLPGGKVKFSLGRVRGGAIRLAPPATEITVTEGLEDALTLQQRHSVPVWAVAGTAMMSALEVPAEVTSVVIGADNDPPGLAAADRAAEAYRQAGREVRIIRPAGGHKDFNAELMAARL